MVRLKAGIKRGFLDSDKSFNSNMVRLKDVRGHINKFLIYVSIPIWYD